MNIDYTTRQLAIAIYTINRHAKTATDNKFLYDLKKLALAKLIKTGRAEKIGLHFVDNPKFSKQHSTTLIRCSDFLFHTIPEKDDFKTLPHLGQQDRASRNPQERMSLKAARTLLSSYLDLSPTETEVIIKTSKRKISPKNKAQSFRSSYLDGR